MGRVASAIVVAWFAGVVHAEPQPTVEPIVRAKQLYNAAAGYYTDHDYVAAAIVFEQAQQAYGRVGRDSGGLVVDLAAVNQQRTALFYEVSAYSLANHPVEASAALVRYRDRFATDLPDVVASCRAANIECDRAQLDLQFVGLEARIGTLTLRGVPAGATVFVDARVVESSQFRLTAGEHLIEVRAAAHKPFLRTIQIEGTKENRFDVELESSETPASVRIEATIAGASVTIDGGKPTPLPVEITVAPGKHHLRVAAETYLDQESDVVVAPGQRTFIKAGMVVRRAPLGLRFEPFLIGTVYLRKDTPFGSGNAGVGLRVFNDHLRYKSVRLGFAFEYQARDLDPIAIGGIAIWCPDATATARLPGGSQIVFCPVSLDTHVVFGGRVTPGFVAGTADGRLGTVVEFQTGSGFIKLALGFGLVTYKLAVGTDNPTNKWLATSSAEVAVGLDL